MKAMIFAAGMGTRLKPLTDTMPKALVPVKGKPLLQILLDRLQQAGIQEAVINVHHFAQQIKNYVQQHPQAIHLNISDESEQLLETGGGIKLAAPLLQGDKPFLVHNVDILHNADLHAFCSSYSDECEAMLMVSERTTQRYLLFDKDMRLVGWTNLQTGEVRSPYPNLKPENYQKFAFSGIHLFHPKLLKQMDEWPEKFPIMDFYLAVCAKVTIRGYVQPNLRLIDVGKLDTLAKAEEFLE